MSVKNTEWQRYHDTLADGGAHYAETNPEKFIVEPWNAVSSLVLLLPALYWALKIRRKLRENLFLAWCIPLLLLGGLGSTLFHAFRSSPFLLWMDVFPMLALTLSLSAYFWHKVLRKTYLTGLVLIAALFLRMGTVSSGIFPVHTAANISYAISGIAIFLPALLVMARTGFRNAGSLVLSILLLIIALVFRETDAHPPAALAMGTHFLWHISSAAGSFFLAEYLHFLSRTEPSAVPVLPAAKKPVEIPVAISTLHDRKAV
jgi:hypothetical protein